MILYGFWKWFAFANLTGNQICRNDNVSFSFNIYRNVANIWLLHMQNLKTIEVMIVSDSCLVASDSLIYALWYAVLF